MATVLRARGKMTRDVSPYDVGDSVVVLVNDRQTDGRVRVGEVGTIRELIISDPNDGDETGGKNVHARVRRMDQPATAEERTWSAHERIAVKRG